MREFFSVEGKFFTVTSKIADMVFLMLLWAVGCIPIITIIPSTATLYHVTVKCIRYDRGKIWEEFWNVYQKNLRQGIGFTLLYGGIGFLIVQADYKLFFRMRSGEEILLFFGVGMLVFTVVYLINLLWLIPVFSRFSNTFGAIMRLSYIISIRNIVASAVLLLLLMAALLLFAVSWPLIFVLPSLLMLLFSYFTEPGMHRYMPQANEGEADWRYGAR